jgi:hypothetical protein
VRSSTVKNLQKKLPEINQIVGLEQVDATTCNISAGLEDGSSVDLQMNVFVMQDLANQNRSGSGRVEQARPVQGLRTCGLNLEKQRRSLSGRKSPGRCRGFRFFRRREENQYRPPNL